MMRRPVCVKEQTSVTQDTEGPRVPISPASSAIERAEFSAQQPIRKCGKLLSVP
jgi:hypothetical protein